MAKGTKKNQTKTTDEIEVGGWEDREVTVKLQPKEVNERRDRAADLQAKEDSLTAELTEKTETFNAFKKEQNTAIDEAGNERAKCLREIKSGETRELRRVRAVKNFTTKKVEYWSDEPTAADAVQYEKETRDFNADEHQRQLFTEQAKAVPAEGMTQEAGTWQ